MAEVQEFEQDVGEIEAVVQQTKQQEIQKVPEPDDDIPDEFKGKSVKDLVGMTIHARKEMGRQANELGEIRKLADEMIKSQIKKPQEIDQPKEVDFFENPQEAIRRAIESNPRVQAAESYAVQAQRAMARQQLQQIHPDMSDIVQSDDFRQWISASPVRQNLLWAADQGFNINAAHELLSTFKELRNIKMQEQQQKNEQIESKARESALKSAAVDTGGSGETTRKVYRRADLIRLKMTDPIRYEAMNDEILAAYAEGRVR
jgi:hypothetical protein